MPRLKDETCQTSFPKMAKQMIRAPSETQGLTLSWESCWTIARRTCSTARDDGFAGRAAVTPSQVTCSMEGSTSKDQRKLAEP
jgi:hypothetical protein